MKRILLLFLVFIGSTAAICQVEVHKSTEIEIYNGKPYYVHVVLKGQTVYSIAKAYGVTTDQVFEANTFAREGIKIGQFLRIPAPDNAVVQNTETPTEITETRDTIYLLTYIAEETISLEQLAQQFKMTVTEIMGYNDHLSDKQFLYSSELARLPVQSFDVLIEYLQSKQHAQVIILHTHAVKKGETLSSIGREYGCSVNELKMFNPGTQEKLKPNMILWVPSKEFFSFESFLNQPQVYDCVKISEKKHYNVALLVPLNLHLVSSIKIDSDRKKNLNKHFRSFDYIHFYEGFMLALNTIDFNGATITLNIYDVDDGSEKINNLISRGVLDVDLIIGPFKKEPLEVLDKWSEDKNIHIVDLYLPSEIDYGLENTKIISAIPSVSEQLNGMIQYIMNVPLDKNVIVVYNENNNEKQLADKIRDIHTENPDYEIQFLQYNSSGMNGLVSLLSHDKQNFIVNFTNNEVFLNNFLRSLFDNAEKYPITLFGLPGWLRFESIDLRYLNHFNTHFFSSQFVDYSRPEVQSFVSDFQKAYLTDPNRLGFLGYDVAKYFLGLLTTYGNSFPWCTESYSSDLLSTGFLFERQTETQQFQNMHVSIFEIIEYELLNVRRTPSGSE